MASELRRDAWELPPLDPSTCGPFADFPRLSNEEKTRVWDEYGGESPSRVPLTLAMNNRVLILDPQYNVDGLTYECIFEEPEGMLLAQLRWQYLVRMRHHHFCDLPTGLPDTWTVSASFHNVYEAASFGASVECGALDVPTTTPFLTNDNKRSVLDLNIDNPLSLGVYQRGIAMTHEMRRMAHDKTFFGRPIEVAPYVELGGDGPLTNALNLRGGDFFKDMMRDPDYAHELLNFITEAGVRRIKAFRAYWDLPDDDQVWFADDAVANISVKQYREFVLPYHRKWFDALDPKREKIRGIHMCGDATRHFKTIVDELGVSAFDTGFPVDFGALRAELGPKVELMGGVEVPLLLNGTPQEIYDRAKAILTSGVCEGERFIMHEANNLPPGAPWANLAAMYKAVFDFGVYE